MSTLKATNIKNDSSASNNIVLDSSGGVVVSGVTTVSAGSASAPSITPIGDNNTGIFFPSADTIAFAEGGVESVRIDSSGRLLLGTTSTRTYAGVTPHIQLEGTSFNSSSISLTANSNDGNSAFLQFYKTRGTSIGSNTVVQSGDYLGALEFYGGDGSAPKSGASINVFVDGTPGTNDMPGRIVFSTTADGASSPTERARIDNSGRLLVGTSSTRTIAWWDTPHFLFEGTDYQKTSLCLYNNQNEIYGAVLSLGHSRGTSVGSNTVLQNNDYTGAIAFYGSDGSNEIRAAEISAYVDNTPGTNDMPGRLVFSTTADGASSPTERMRIANNGRMSVGSNISDNGHWMTNPGTDTSVLRLRQTQNSAGVLGLYYDGQPNNTNDRFLSCLDNNGGTARCHIQSNGGIANFQANNSNLSDARSKKDISPASATWNYLKEWEIVNYRYKDQTDDSDLNLGVIAQQVAESCPEVITIFQESKEATETEPAQEERLGVKEQQMYWMAIKTLQEAQVRIEALEDQIASLKPQ